MNIRKNIDYSEMYAALDAGVAAAEYLRKHHADVEGFSPRNLRRMRAFWRTYENHPARLSLVMDLGWTQNAVIMEADLTMELRDWYLRAARQFSWSKTELIVLIAAEVHGSTSSSSVDLEAKSMRCFQRNHDEVCCGFD